jgi:uncharacterized small protein (DUF1192 family)
MATSSPPLSENSRDSAPTCRGHAWEIADRTVLIQLVARLILGQYRHALKILSAQSGPAPKSHQTMIEKAVSQLDTPANDTLRAHRDGWIFQMISWIALHLADVPSIASIPQCQPADKGFDSVALILQDDDVSAVLISEDKATIHPRDVFRDKVIPEFKDIEKGNRDAQIVDETTALLERLGLTDVDTTLNAIHWHEIRRYRAALTVNEDSRANHQSLFKDYDNAVNGDIVRRRGDTFLLSPLRDWMDAFCQDVQEELRRIDVEKTS